MLHPLLTSCANPSSIVPQKRLPFDPSSFIHNTDQHTHPPFFFTFLGKHEVGDPMSSIHDAINATQSAVQCSSSKIFFLLCVYFGAKRKANPGRSSSLVRSMKKKFVYTMEECCCVRERVDWQVNSMNWWLFRVSVYHIKWDGKVTKTPMTCQKESSISRSASTNWDWWMQTHF